MTRRLLLLLAPPLLLAGCFLIEDPEEPSREESAGTEESLEPVEDSGGDRSAPADEAAAGDSSGAAGTTTAESDSPGAAGSTAEPDPNETTGTASAADSSTAGDDQGSSDASAPVPLELLSGFPEEPRWPQDARIGRLTAGRLEESARARTVSREADRFFAALFSGEGAILDAFYDPYSGEELVEKVSRECGDVRTGVPQLLPQEEWLVPFRCLLNGEPVPLSGELYLRYEDSPEVVDAVVEPGEPMGDFDPAELTEDTVPF